MGIGANETMSDSEKTRVSDFMKAGLAQLQEMADIKESLADLAKTVGEELNVKHTVLIKALRTAFKQTLEADKETIDAVEEILVLTGRA